MALVSGRSTLNPNAPLFVPAALRQVEDFSPEWWQLVTTSTWYHDYWLSQNQDEHGFYDNGEDSYHLDVGEDFSNFEAAQFEEFLQLSQIEGKKELDTSAAILKNLKASEDRRPKLLMEPRKYAEKPSKFVSSKCSPRFIQQPR